MYTYVGREAGIGAAILYDSAKLSFHAHAFGANVRDDDATNKLARVKTTSLTYIQYIIMLSTYALSLSCVQTLQCKFIN